MTFIIKNSIYFKNYFLWASYLNEVAENENHRGVNAVAEWVWAYLVQQGKGDRNHHCRYEDDQPRVAAESHHELENLHWDWEWGLLVHEFVRDALVWWWTLKSNPMIFRYWQWRSQHIYILQASKEIYTRIFHKQGLKDDRQNTDY